MFGDHEGVKVIGIPDPATIHFFCSCLKSVHDVFLSRLLLSIVPLPCLYVCANPLVNSKEDGWLWRWMKFSGFCRILPCKKQTTFSPICVWIGFAHSQKLLLFISVIAYLLLTFWDAALPQGIRPMLQLAQGKSEAVLWGPGDRMGGEMKWGLSLNQPSCETSSLGSEAGRAAHTEAVLLQLCCYSMGAKLFKAR